jgi:hypothetical protein
MQPFVSWYDSWFLDELQGRHAWSVIKVRQWQAGVWFVWGYGSRGCKEVWLLKWCHAHFRVSDNKQLGHVHGG